MPTTPDELPAVQFHRSGLVLHVRPAPEELLREVLFTNPRHEHFSNAFLSGMLVNPLFALARQQQDGQVDVVEGAGLTLVGLERAVRNLLSGAGYTVASPDLDLVELPPPDLARLQGENAPDSVDLGMLEFIRSHDRGLIRYDTPDDGWLIAQIALAWPAHSIVVPMIGGPQAFSLGSYLQNFLPDVGILVSKSAPSVRNRILVATEEALDAHSGELVHRQILLVTDDLATYNGLKVRILQAARSARVYRLRSSANKFKPDVEDRLRLFFGFDEVEIPAHGKRHRPVRVGWAQGEDGLKLPARLGKDDVVHQGIWQNAARNEQIARYAQLLATGHVAELEHLLPGVAGHDLGGSPRRVAVLAGGGEQLLELVACLPEWPLVARINAAFADLDIEVQKLIRNALDRPCLGCAIVSPGGAEQIDWNSYDVVVRADGLNGLPAANLRNPIENESELRPALLVDFDDRSHTTLRRLTKSRRQAYQSAGWAGPGVSEADARVEQFLERGKARIRKARRTRLMVDS